MRSLVLGAAALLLTPAIDAQTPSSPRKSSAGVVERAPSATNNVDPARAAVERADAEAKEFEQPVMDDPTVFVKGAALGALTVIEFSRLVQSRSQDAKVRGLAERVLVNQGALRTQLTAIAKRQKLDVPTSLIDEDQQRVQTAAGRSGAELDRWYVRQMIEEHQKSIALFNAASRMPDKELAAFAKKVLPTLNDEQQAALVLLP